MTLDAWSRHWPELAALLILIAASAFFSGSEAALISLSRLQARGMAERGVKGAAAVLRLLDDRNRFMTSILIGNTIVLLAADSLATLIFVSAGVPNAGALVDRDHDRSVACLRRDHSQDDRGRE